MANFRQIHVKIWKDAWFLDLEPDEKLLFIYLFSNELTSIAGIYKLPLKVICFETGLTREFVETAMKRFSNADRVHYKDGVVWVVNMRRYHDTGSPKLRVRIQSDLDEIPHSELKIRYLNGMDRVSLIKEQENKQEQVEEEEQQQVNNNVAAAAATALRNRGVADKTAQSLIHEERPETIMEYCRAMDWHNQKNGKDYKAGWLVRAIREGYALPDGFLTDQRQNDPQKYVTGKFADYIES